MRRVEEGSTDGWRGGEGKEEDERGRVRRVEERSTDGGNEKEEDERGRVRRVEERSTDEWRGRKRMKEGG